MSDSRCVASASLAWVVAATLAACSAQSALPDSAGTRCTTGTSISCACTDGTMGTQSCGADGTYSSCACGISDSGVDVADISLDVSGDARDAGGATDASVDASDSGADALDGGTDAVDVATDATDVVTVEASGPPGFRVIGGSFGSVTTTAGAPTTGFSLRAQGFTNIGRTCSGGMCVSGGIVP